MSKAIQITNPQQVMVSDRVKFSHKNQDVFGYVAKKGRKYAHVVDDNEAEYRVPYQRLFKIPGEVKHVQTRAERLRLEFSVNDQVRFDYRGEVHYGMVSRLNPKYALVIGSNDLEYRVPYALLNRISPSRQPNDSSNRRQSEPDDIAAQAKALMTKHRLNDWSFQFDEASKRAGCCRYETKVISLSYEYARHAPASAIQNTILHEIAHALVGQEHHHDAVWRAKAVEIGCSGERCHDIQFTPPRYIMKCENNCWVATAERRRRNRICKTCKGEVVYLTYTEARWNEEHAHMQTGHS